MIVEPEKERTVVPAMSALNVVSCGDPNHQYEAMAEDLEKRELESANGIATPEIYAQLLAIYLLQNDLTNAKFLWKRIPTTLKEENPELGKLWKVGQKLWNRDPAVYEALTEEWSESVKPILAAINDKTRNRALQLLSKAYSSISCDYIPVFLGLPPEECMEMVKSLGWEVDMEANVVKPKKNDRRPEEPTPSEEQLAKLTEFVSFLEN